MRERSSGRRDGRRLAVPKARILLAVVAAIVAVYAVRDTVGTIVARANPALAYRMAPWDGRNAAQLARELTENPQTPRDGARAEELARRALAQDPTAVEAVNVLATRAQLRGKPGETADLFRYSLSLSRRELPSRLWAIESAVSRGDVRGALHNYDYALRTSRDAAAILFPILANALDEPKIRTELVALMRPKPNWSADFVTYLAQAAVNPAGTAQFYPQLERAGLAVSAEQHASVVNALAGRSLYEQAWRYYQRDHADAARDRSRDPRFAASSEISTVYDWQAFSDGGIAASIVEGQRGGELTFSVSPSASGKLAEQRQLLPAGGYRLSGTSSPLALAERERPYWTVICDDGRELARVPIPADGRKGFARDFVVPSGCPAQQLQLIARQSDAAQGYDGSVLSLALVPLG